MTQQPDPLVGTSPEGPVPYILVVDDSAQNRMLAEAHLTAAGYEVGLAEDGSLALAAFTARTPDLVLLDILMPELDGIETCRAIRKLPGGADVPVVFLTALDDAGTYRAALASGADDFLSKPSSRVELLLRVRSLLRIKRMGTEIKASLATIASQRDALVRLQEQQALLSALVVHDLKNPLAGILANLEYVEGAAGLDSECREAVADGLQSAQAMHRLIMTLLDIGRAEEGTLTLLPSDIDLVALVEQIRSDHRHHLAARDLSLAVELAVPRIFGDDDLLHRLLENLVDNAIKYTGRGTTITVRSRRDDAGAVVVQVIDQGPGVPLEQRERIFEKYQRLESQGPLARTSRGLGLVFCRLAAEAHGGRIHVEDAAPRGVAFCVTLPQTGGAPPPHGRSEARP